jgi:hypothetical protein
MKKIQDSIQPLSDSIPHLRDSILFQKKQVFISRSTADSLQKRQMQNQEILNRQMKALNDSLKTKVLTPKQVKGKALELVTALRQLIRDSRTKEQLMSRYYDSLMQSEPNGFQKYWDQRNREYSNLTFVLMQDFDQKFKDNALLLRAQIIGILTQKNIAVPKNDIFYYEHPVNPLGIDDVATNLATLANSIPD